MSDEVEAKDPDSVLDYTINWATHLGADTIVSSDWILETGITQNSESNTSQSATIWLSGGTKNTVYRVTNRIVTAAGRTLDKTLVIPVQDL